MITPMSLMLFCCIINSQHASQAWWRVYAFHIRFSEILPTSHKKSCKTKGPYCPYVTFGSKQHHDKPVLDVTGKNSTRTMARNSWKHRATWYDFLSFTLERCLDIFKQVHSLFKNRRILVAFWMIFRRSVASKSTRHKNLHIWFSHAVVAHLCSQFSIFYTINYWAIDRL